MLFKSNECKIENDEKNGIINIIYDVYSYTNDDGDELGGQEYW